MGDDHTIIGHAAGRLLRKLRRSGIRIGNGRDSIIVATTLCFVNEIEVSEVNLVL